MNYLDFFGGREAVQHRINRAVRERLMQLPLQTHTEIARALRIDPTTLRELTLGEGHVPFRLFQSLQHALDIPIDEVLPKPTIPSDDERRIWEDMRNRPLVLAGGVGAEKDYRIPPAVYASLNAIEELARDEATPEQPLGVLQAEFDVEREVQGYSLAQVTKDATERLAEQCVVRPALLYTLGSRQFEEVIAEILHRLGYTVELTAQTRDGGRDIVAVRNDVVAVRYLVECKRYDAARKISVGAVRSLHGVVQDERATKGILATTSYFSAPATEFIDRNRWVLEGRDYDGLLDWLKRYDTAQREPEQEHPELQVGPRGRGPT